MPTAGRGSLPFALIHGESLVASATWALEAAEVILLGHGATIAWLAERHETLVLHDPLCPLTPPEFIAQCVAEALTDNVVVAAARPVTDTVKVLAGPVIGGTIDREDLLTITSPVVIPPDRIGDLLALGPDSGQDLDLDSVRFVDLVAALVADQGGVRFCEAPALGARVHDPADLKMLEGLSRSAAPAGSTQE